jgi:hypothetical protein
LPLNPEYRFIRLPFNVAEVTPMLEAGKVVTVGAEPAMAGDAHNWIASNDKTTHKKNLFTSPLLITIVFSVIESRTP